MNFEKIVISLLPIAGLFLSFFISIKQMEISVSIVDLEQH